MTAHQLFDQTAADYMVAGDREVLESKREVYRDEHIVEIATNGKRIVTSRRLPIIGANGDTRYIVGVVEDVTEFSNLSPFLRRVIFIREPSLGLSGQTRRSWRRRLSRPCQGRGKR